MHGGDMIASVLEAQGTRFLFTLCGGHISPILVGCKARGIRVIDTRHEATAVFAADAVARLTGRPSVAAVTAGPGLTNTITAVKNAQIAQSPVVLLGGAAPTMLKGRGALQDIDQMALLRPHVKWARAARRVRDLAPALEEAFAEAQRGVPGPVFVECPVDLLYDEATVRAWYVGASRGRSLADRALKAYLGWHARRLFAGSEHPSAGQSAAPPAPEPDAGKIHAAAERLSRAERPLLLIGSQALSEAAMAPEIARAVERLGVPAYLSGMARGLLGRDHPLQARHQRREALKRADMVILAGVPADFRLDYGRQIRRSATYVAANRSPADLRLNRRPDVGVLGDAGRFLCRLADALDLVKDAGTPAKTTPNFGGRTTTESENAPPAAIDPPPAKPETTASALSAWRPWRRGDSKQPQSDAVRVERWRAWLAELRARDDERDAEIERRAHEPAGNVNPLHLCRELEAAIGREAVLVGDGGDFVATAAYTVRPRGPLAWLDPGAFGTLGVGAGFALGAKLCRPEAEVWAIFGDGALGYSLAELDTFARHGIPIVAVVGNDGGWSQIAREQIEILGDDVGTVLGHADYHRVAEGFGAAGFLADDPELVAEILQQARQAALAGRPALVNVILGKSEFRKGSVSM